jgi:membrane protein required for colicin V production
MGAIDWAILGVIVISTLISIKRGFVKEALSLTNLVVAVVLSRMFGGQVSSLLVDVIEIPSVRLGVAMAALFFCSLIVGGLITRLMSEVIRVSGLDGTDSFLGMFFGLARGGLIVLVVIAVLHYLVPVEQDTWWRESLLIPHFVSAVEWLGPMLWEQGEQLIDDAMGRVT